jgi:peptidoglycan/LPS O-acetylase OafA/YrhL
MQNQAAPKANHFAGFDGLRLIAAVSVIFSHSFLIATGSEENEPLVRLLGPRNSAGLYGVYTFFVISGFLLARSLRSNPSLATYSVNRVLRIVPAFAACTLVMAFIVGPICSRASLSAYYSSPVTWSFVASTLNGFSDWPLPGVFAYDAGLATVVNASLWSLPYEALSYIFLVAVWMSCRSPSLATGAIVTIALCTWKFPVAEKALAGIAFTLPFFAGGVFMQWVHAHYGTHRILAILSAVLLVAAGFFGWQTRAFALLGAYLIVFFGERQNPGSKLAAKIGDCSYGLYLYAWPAEQILRQFTGTTNPFWLFLGALPFAGTLAFLSCHLIERPAMKRRGAVAALMRSAFNKLFKGVRAPAVIGAKIVFVVGALLMLTRGPYWLITWNMGRLLVLMMAGSAIAVVTHRLGVRVGLWQPPST